MIGVVFWGGIFQNVVRNAVGPSNRPTKSNNLYFVGPHFVSSFVLYRAVFIVLVSFGFSQLRFWKLHSRHRQTTHGIGLKYLIWFACTMHSPGHQLACASILNFKEVIYLFDIRSNLFQSGICLQKWLFCTVFLDKVWSSENTFFSQMKEFKRQTHHLLKK